MTNTINRKVYVGKVEFPRDIEDKWHRLLINGRKLRKERESNPEKVIYASHFKNDLAKYDESVWQVSQLDIAFNLEELNFSEKNIIFGREIKYKQIVREYKLLDVDGLRELTMKNKVQYRKDKKKWEGNNKQGNGYG